MGPDPASARPHNEATGLVGLVRTLAIVRLALLAVTFGMSMAVAISIVLGLGKLLTGTASSLLGFGGLALPAAAALVASRIAIPRIDRRLLAEARAATDPAACLPLMQLLTGIPIGLNAGPIAVELARLLGTVDAEWWQQNEREMRQEVLHALQAQQQAQSPGFLRPSAADWTPALFDAIARCGRTELLGQVEKVERAAGRSGASAAMLDAARRCAEELRREKERARMAAMLLRPAEPPGAETLLRPASVDGQTDAAVLLRPSSAPEEPAPATTVAAERPAESEQKIGPLR